MTRHVREFNDEQRLEELRERFQRLDKVHPEAIGNEENMMKHKDL